MRPILLFSICFTTLLSQAQTLVRKAPLHIIGKNTDGGIVVDSVINGGTAQALRIKKHDVIISFNQKEVKNMVDFNSVGTKIRTGDNVEVTYLRDGKKFTAKGKGVMRPLEQSDLADVIYDWVKFRDGYLRTIVRKPKSKSASLPCILLIPGYGCGSIENYSQSYNGKLINEWLKSGYAVVTIEKSGMGDSYGCQPCADADLATDIESFNAGYEYMENLGFVDKNALFIWGHSLGGMIAPEIAKLHKPRGVMVFGTVFRPWSEFLLEMHRVQKPLLDNLSFEETETFVRLIQKVYYEFFILKKSRAELYNIPEYKAIVASELEHKEGTNNMWGRHWRFWQEIDSLNLALSWKKTDCPVLVLNGGSDYEQCAPIEPILIEQTVNAAHPGTATRVQIEDLDHFMMKSATFKEAADNFKNQAFNKGNFNYRISVETVNWLNKQCGKT